MSTSLKFLGLRFKLSTINLAQEHALLFFMGNERAEHLLEPAQPDFLSVALHRGDIVFRLNLGHGESCRPVATPPNHDHMIILSAELGVKMIRQPLAPKTASAAHKVELGHWGRRLWLSVDDGGNTTALMPGAYGALNVGPLLLVGGPGPGPGSNGSGVRVGQSWLRFFEGELTFNIRF